MGTGEQALQGLGLAQERRLREREVDQITACHANLYSHTPEPPFEGHTLEQVFKPQAVFPYHFRKSI